MRRTVIIIMAIIVSGVVWSMWSDFACNVPEQPATFPRPETVWP